MKNIPLLIAFSIPALFVTSCADGPQALQQVLEAASGPSIQPSQLAGKWEGYDGSATYNWTFSSAGQYQHKYVSRRTGTEYDNSRGSWQIINNHLIADGDSNWFRGGKDRGALRIVDSNHLELTQSLPDGTKETVKYSRMN